VVRLALARPRSTVLLATLVTLLAAAGVTRLEIRTDGRRLVPAEAPAVAIDRAIRDDFGLRDRLVVVVRSDGASGRTLAGEDEGIFGAEALRVVRDLTEDLAALGEVDPGHVASLATERGDRVYPGTVTLRPFLDPLPVTEEERTRLRADLRAIDVYRGTLVSRDESAAAIFIGVRPGVDRTALYRAVAERAARAQTEDLRVSVVGAPAAEALLGAHLLDDLGIPEAIVGARVGRTEDARAGAAPIGAWTALRATVARTVGLLPVAIAVMAGVFLVAFRRIAAVLIALVEVAACLLFTFGLMGWCGEPVTLTIAVMPVILTAMGVADEIHILHRYRTIVAHAPEATGDSPPGGAPGHRALVRRAMAEMTRPVVRTSVTTAIGFLSFTTSEIAPVRAFGLFTAAGVLFCMIWSLTVIPATLVLLAPRRVVGRGPAAASAPALLARFATAIVRRRFLVLGAAGAVLLAAPFGIRRVMVQDSWIDGFSRDSAFARDTRAFNAGFLGMHQLVLALRTPPFRAAGEVSGSAITRDGIAIPARAAPDPQRLLGGRLEISADGGEPARGRIVGAAADGEVVTLRVALGPEYVRPLPALRAAPRVRFTIDGDAFHRPALIEMVGRLERFVAERGADEVGGVIGPHRLAATTNFLLAGRVDAFRTVPPDPARLERVWREHARVRGESELGRLFDASGQRALVTIFLANANYRSTQRLMVAVRAFEREHLAPEGVSVEFAGDVAVSQALIDAVVRTQLRSSLLSLVAIFAVTALLARSIRTGLLCVLPPSIAVAAVFACMGWTGVPLGVATSMFSAMTLGVGEDFAVHLIESRRLAIARGADRARATIAAVVASGPAILADAVGVTLGFGVLMLSLVPANARLGAMLAVGIAACCVATLVVLPAILAGPRPATSAALRTPEGVAVDLVGDARMGDTGNHRVREVDLGVD
jgi:hypothetical protein